MAKKAVEAGYRRLYFVTREFWCEGDTLLFHGIIDKAHKFGLETDAVRLQNLPESAGEAVMQSIMEPLIRRAAGESAEPIAFLCRSNAIAQQLYIASQSCAVWDPRRMLIVFDAAFDDNPKSPPAPPGVFVRSQKSLQEAFSFVARILSEINKPDSPAPEPVKLPVV